MTNSIRGHSATVKMELCMDTLKIPLRQVGPTFLILGCKCDVPNARGIVTLSIDGRETFYHVTFPKGLRSDLEMRCAVQYSTAAV